MKEITYDMGVFFQNLAAIPEKNAAEVEKKKKIMDILELISQGDPTINAELLEKVTLEDIQAAYDEVENYDCTNPQPENLLSDMVKVEWGKTNLNSMTPPRTTNKKNFF